MLSVGSLPDMTCKINPADLENVPSGTSGKPVSYWSLSTVYCFFFFKLLCVFNKVLPETIDTLEH